MIESSLQWIAAHIVLWDCLCFGVYSGVRALIGEYSRRKVRAAHTP